MHTPKLHFEEAIARILAESRAGDRVLEWPIVDAAGLVLAEEIVSDIDAPAFDRAAMDGYAFRHADARERATSAGLLVLGAVIAGAAPGMLIPDEAGRPGTGPREPRPFTLGANECVKIMTGAPVPEGADTIIPVEQTSGYVTAGERAHFRDIPERGSHIVSRGQNLRAGETVLRPGRLLAPAEVALLASVGRVRVRAHAGPRVAFAATGEELREPGEPLPAGCIRNSNAYNLWAQIRIARAEPAYLGILPDRQDILRERIAAGLEADFLVLSGGVSMGEYDLVTGVLREAGVELRFEKLFVRPGQPTVFGVRDSGGARTLVFGLPGNPISTLFAFDQYVAPAIRVFRHHPQPLATTYQGTLTETVRKKAGNLSLVGCVSTWKEDHFELAPTRPQGSSDLAATRGIDAIGMISAEVTEALAGSQIAFRKLHEP